MANYPAGVTDMDDHFDLPSVGDEQPDFYNLRLDTYEHQVMNMIVYEGSEPLALTLEEIQTAKREYERRNPKGRYSIVPTPSLREKRMRRDGITEEDIEETRFPTSWQDSER